jgi:Tfp pilus assembly protein PilN
MLPGKKEVDIKEKAPESLLSKSTNTINLIPDVTAKEKKKVEKKENINLTSAALVFFVMLFTVGLLLYNFNLKNNKTQKESELSVLEAQLTSQKVKELKLKNTISKYEAIRNLKKSDLQYSYLTEEVANFPSAFKVKSISLTSGHQFEISGLVSDQAAFNSQMEVLEGSELFSNINIDEMVILDTDQLEKARLFKENQYRVSWQISGDFFKEVTTAEAAADLTETE